MANWNGFCAGSSASSVFWSPLSSFLEKKLRMPLNAWRKWEDMYMEIVKAGDNKAVEPCGLFKLPVASSTVVTESQATFKLVTASAHPGPVTGSCGLSGTSPENQIHGFLTAPSLLSWFIIFQLSRLIPNNTI